MFRGLQALTVMMFVGALSGVIPSGQSSPAALQGSGVTIVGSVVDAALAPIAGVAITLERGGRVEAKTTTDAAGIFRFAAVAPGNYRVRAEHSGFPAFARDLRVPSGVTAVQLPIVLARARDDLPAAKTETQASGSTVTGAAPAPSAQPQLSAPGNAGVGGGFAGAFGGGGAAMDRLTITGEAPILAPNGDRSFFPPLRPLVGLPVSPLWRKLRARRAESLSVRARSAAVHLWRRRGYRVVLQRSPLPLERPAAAARRGARRGAGELLPVRV